jgi:hypothetical protein
MPLVLPMGHYFKLSEMQGTVFQVEGEIELKGMTEPGGVTALRRALRL